MRRVTLIHTDVETTVLGFGTAALMGKLSERESMRLLDVAYDCGIRHFDTAPLYAFGDAEVLLGKFLRRHPDVTVATKYGLTTRTLQSSFIRGAKRILRPLFRGRPTLAYSTGVMVRKSFRPVANFDPAAAEKSLRTSLRRLRRDQIDVFLLHECRRVDVESKGLLEFLERCRVRGLVRQFGIATDISTIEYCLRFARDFSRILQFANNRETPNLSSLHVIAPDIACITHTPFGGMRSTMTSTDPAYDLRYALEQNSRGVVLFSSQKPEHIVKNAHLAEQICA